MRLVCLFFLFAFPLYSFSQIVPENIEPDLWFEAMAAPDKPLECIILLRDHIDSDELLLEMESAGLSRSNRCETVIRRLQSKAGETQPEFLRVLESIEGLEQQSTQSLWIVNAVIAMANKSALEKIAANPEVDLIFGLEAPSTEQPEEKAPALASPNGIEPGLEAIEAPFMWQMGYTGYGRKVMVMDTGEDPEHPALRQQYWGHNVPKSESWNGSGYPEDCTSHGTHVTGTSLGLDRETNDTIGVAFNARWMAAPVDLNDCDLNPFNQTIYSAFASFQWALDPDGDPNTDDAPDVINCSWGNSGANYCSPNSPIQQAMTNMEAAGLPIIWCAGNSGPGSATQWGQPEVAISEVNAFSVGNINAASPSFPIAITSSRGPSDCGGGGALEIKPEVVAPGSGVRSSISGGGYAFWTGTSMAAPHVAGSIALLREAFPTLSGIAIKEALYYSAVDLGVPGEDNDYGRGIINLRLAYQYLIDQGHTPVTPTTWDRDAIVLDYWANDICNGPIGTTVKVENAGSETINSLEFLYGIENGPQESYTWNGTLLTDEVVDIELPGLVDLPAGMNEIFVQVDAVNEQSDSRPLNNRFKRRFEKFEEDPAAVSVSPHQSLPACKGTRLLLSYDQAPEPNEIVQWFESPTSNSPIFEGTNFLTSPLLTDQTYFVSTSVVDHLGKTSTDATSVSADGGLVFDVHQELLLKSVKVFSSGPGGRVVRLTDADDNTISQKIIFVQPGEQRAELNFTIPRGEDYRLVLGSGSQGLIYAATDVTYPYELPGIVTIKRSTNTGPFYDYFFDWEVSSPLICGREPISLQVDTSSTSTSVTIDGPDTLYLSQGNTAQFTDNTPGASNQTWDFGNGTTGSGSTATATYNTPGDYVVTLFNRNSQGCNNAGQRNIHVTSSVSAEEPALDKSAAYIFPNPTGDVMYIGFEEAPAGEVDLAIFDLYGRQVLTQNSIPTANGILETPVNTLPGGMYVVQLRQQGQLLWFGKFAVGR